MTWARRAISDRELVWHTCPTCGLAGWARRRFSYCRLHGEQPPEEAPLPKWIKLVGTWLSISPARALAFEEPGSLLYDLIKRFGGYDNITPEGWAEYDVAMAEWREETR